MKEELYLDDSDWYNKMLNKVLDEYHDDTELGLHNSGKRQKRKLKPQALRQAKARLRQFKKRHMTPPNKRGSFV